jgi:uncharacterized protein involved in type VI secretion and phage assembly
MEEADVLENIVRRQRTRYYGKYRALVIDNLDPEKRGRLKLTIPSVLGEATSAWALPCFPYGGAAGLGFIAVPPIGAMVAAEFMEGDLSAPLWTGAFWRAADEVPAEVSGDGASTKLLKTDSGHVLSFEDASGSEAVTLTSAMAAVMALDPDGGIALTDKNGATVTIDAAAGEIRIADANGNKMVLASSGISVTDANGNQITTAAGGVTVKGTSITVQGSQVSIGGAGGEPLVKGASMMALFNAHTHVCSVPGSPSSPPVTPMLPAQLSTVATTT